jgi:hypothetical protein
MSVDAQLIEEYTQGMNAPFSSQAGYWVRANAAGTNVEYFDAGATAFGPKRGVDLTDATVSIQVSQGNSRILLASVPLTANRTITLQTTGATTGELIRITRLGLGAFTLAIVNGGGGGGTKYTFPVSIAREAEFTYDGTNWQLLKHWAV